MSKRTNERFTNYDVVMSDDCLSLSQKKSIVNDLYQAAVISVLAVGHSMLGKKILKITPPSVQKFDLEDRGKLIAIVAASEMTR